jgi:hypothetical protein
LHQLIALGLNPGVQVTVHRASPAFIIKFENTELALDKEIAKNIYVWKTRRLSENSEPAAKSDKLAHSSADFH